MSIVLVSDGVLENRGFLYEPICPMYGFAALVLVVLSERIKGKGGIIKKLAIATLWCSVLEYLTSLILEVFFGIRWWDYSNIKWNLDGYICLPASLFWGVLGYLAVRWCNGVTLILLHILPKLLMHIVLLTLIGVLFVDIFGSFMLLTGKSKKPERWIATDAGMDKISTKIAGKIAGSLEKRLKKAYPKARKIEEEIREENEEKVFAKGCDFYKIVMLFMIGAFLGDITETIFCRVTAGVWMSRSSVVWGPFSIVWGLAIALVTALLYKYKDKGDRFLFLTGTLLGGAYEYFCSVFTELVFGKVFWDYSKIPFNLGGRINLLYCFFWGIAAVVWFKILFPPVEKWIEKIPAVAGKLLTWFLLVFMVCNILVSCVALVRYDERGNGVQATNVVQKWVDVHYDDAKMEKIYPNAKATE